MKTKRILAYIVDTLIIMAISYLIIIILGDTSNQQNIVTINEQLLNNEISISTFFKEYAHLTYQNDTSNLVPNMINVIIIMALFILIPLITKGQTIGLKIFNLRINYTKTKQLFSRALLLNGLAYIIISILSLLVFNNIIYMILITVFLLLQIILLIINVISFNKQDNITLIDKITNSRIEEKI